MQLVITQAPIFPHYLVMQAAGIVFAGTRAGMRHSGDVKRWTSTNGVFAAKIMWRHLKFIHERLAADPEGAALVKPTPWETLATLHPAPLVVHVTRRDKVRQAISMVRAKQTGVYSTVHVDAGRKQEVAPGEYDFQILRYHVEKLTKEDQEWEELFRTHKVPVQTVVFEDFIKDPQNLTVALLKNLGFPEPEKWQWPQTQIRSQSDSINSEWRARYLEDEKKADKKDEKK